MARISKQASLNEVKQPILASRVFDHNTFVYTVREGETRYRLHHTDIVVVEEGVSITLFTGGWRTVTTKDRINKILSAVFRGREFWVTQHKGKWWLCQFGGAKDIEFFEGISITLDGYKVSAEPYSISRGKVKLERRMEKVRKWAKAIEKDGPPIPGPGDCWLCMFAANKEGHRVTLADVKKDAEHLLSHVDQNYLHGYLVVLALKVAGYSQSQVEIFYSMALSDGGAFHRKRMGKAVVNLYKSLLGVAL